MQTVKKISFLSAVFWVLLASVASAFTSESSRASVVNAALPKNQFIAQADEKAEVIILELGLADDQIFQLTQVDERFNPQLNELYPAWNEAQENLENLIRSRDSSEDEVRDKYEEVETLRLQISEIQFERRMAIRAILRPEQRLLYEQYIDQIFSESGS